MNRTSIINKTIKIMNKIFDKDYEKLVKNMNNRHLPKIELYTLYDVNNKFVYNSKIQTFYYTGILGYNQLSNNTYDNYVKKEKIIKESDIQFLLEIDILTKGGNSMDKYLSSEELEFHKFNHFQNTTFGYYRHIYFLELIDKNKK
jgi:hypothetical protein